MARNIPSGLNETNVSAAFLGLANMLGEYGKDVTKRHNKAEELFDSLLKDKSLMLKPGMKYKTGMTTVDVKNCFTENTASNREFADSQPIGEANAKAIKETLMTVNPTVANQITPDITYAGLRSIQTVTGLDIKNTMQASRLKQQADMWRDKKQMTIEERAQSIKDTIFKTGVLKPEEWKDYINDTNNIEFLQDYLKEAGLSAQDAEKITKFWGIEFKSSTKTIVPNLNKPTTQSLTPGIGTPTPTPSQTQQQTQQQAPSQQAPAPVNNDKEQIKSIIRNAKSYQEAMQQLRQLPAARGKSDEYLDKIIQAINPSLKSQMSPTGVTETPGMQQQLQQSLQQRTPMSTGAPQQTSESDLLLPNASPGDNIKALLYMRQAKRNAAQQR